MPVLSLAEQLGGIFAWSLEDHVFIHERENKFKDES